MGLLGRVYQWCGRPAWMKRVHAWLSGPGPARKEYLPQAWLDTVSAWCGGFTGKRVLEVGSDTAGSLVAQISRLYQPAEVIGLNPLGPTLQIAPGCRLETKDIRKTAYADGYFDVIVSSAAFEHIDNLDVALAEMHRILKPGGYLFSHFGPIWSGPYGHHLWLTHDGTVYNYWNVILPPYCHLLMTREEVAQGIAKDYAPEVCRVILDFIFGPPERKGGAVPGSHAPDPSGSSGGTSDRGLKTVAGHHQQNRLFYEDYESIIRKSRFEVLLLKGYDHPELDERYTALMTPETFESLRARYPEHRHFGYAGMTVLLAKPR